MKKEYDLKKMKRVARAPLDPKETKIAMTIRIDGDVVLWFRKEAERTGIPYQTLLNAKLRESINLPDRVETLVQEKFDALTAKQQASY